MNAYVNHKFKSGFLLGEEAIVKIHDLIETRAKELSPEAKPKLKVYRSDNSVYEADGIGDLRNEENAKRNRIQQVDFLVEDDQMKLTLSFENESLPSLKIEATDRDKAFLLFSEIKEYLHTECLILRRPFSDRKESLVSLIGLMVAQAGMLIYFVLKSLFPSEKRRAIEEAISSPEATEKLNALLQDKLSTDKEAPMVLGGMIGLVILIFVGGYVIQKIYPSSVFYLGKEIESYDRLKSNRSKWIWGIGISFIVSFIAGLVVWLLTRSS